MNPRSIFRVLEPLLAFASANMAPRKCLGYVADAEGEAADPCVFNGNGTGRPANALTHGRCVWCCPEEMARRLASPKLGKFLIYTLVNFKNANEEVFEKAKGRLPEDRADILAEVDARLEPENEDVEMAPAAEDAEGKTAEDEEEETEFAELGVVADNLNDGEGELDIDAVDVGEVDFGNALGEVGADAETKELDTEAANVGEVDFGNALRKAESPFELNNVEMLGEERAENDGAEEAAPKKRRLRGKQAAPIYGPPLPLAAAVGAVAVTGQALRR